MSRFDEATARLRSGGAVVLLDEDQEAEAYLIAAETAAAARPVLLRLGRGEISAVRRHGAAPSRTAADDAGASAGLQAIAVEAAAGGVLARRAGAEAAVDLMQAAGLDGPVLLRALALPGGLLAKEGEASRLARAVGLPAVSIQDIVAHRVATETIVEEVAMAHLPSLYSDEPLEVRAYRGLIDGIEHLALLRRPADGAPFGPDPLVRLHSECLTGDALGSLRCDCGEQLRRALKLIGEDPAGGIVVYLRGQEGRGIGLANKIKAYALQEQGRDTVEANLELGFPADLRDYGAAVQILRSLGVTSLRLLSNNPVKRAALERHGIRVAERRAIRIGPNPHNADYLETKRVKMGHDLAALRRVASE
jgi:3,4-dihydroxy 2-butanone 4-phosphate synthase/GTP cyclohydrolase II